MTPKKSILQPHRTYSQVQREFNRRNNANVSRSTVYTECLDAEKKLAKLLAEVFSEAPTPERIEKIVRKNWSLPRMRKFMCDCIAQLRLPF